MSNEQIPSLPKNPTKKEILSFMCKRYGTLDEFNYAEISEAYDTIKEVQPTALDRRTVLSSCDLLVNGKKVDVVIEMLAKFSKYENARVVTTDAYEDSIKVNCPSIEDDFAYISRLFLLFRDEVIRKKCDTYYEREKTIRKEIDTLQQKLANLQKELSDLISKEVFLRNA